MEWKRHLPPPVRIAAGKLADLLSQKIFRQLRLPLWTRRLLVVRLDDDGDAPVHIGRSFRRVDNELLRPKLNAKLLKKSRAMQKAEKAAGTNSVTH